MRQIIPGSAAARGSALGRARVRLPHALDIEEVRIHAGDVEAELARFQSAVTAVQEEMRHLRNRLHGALAQEIGEFLDLHTLLLDDPELLSGIEDLIRTGLYAADYALRLQRNRIAAVFEGMDDPYLRSRIDDIDQVIGRLHAALQSRHPVLQGNSGEILVADTVAPAELAQLQAQGVIGVITSGGSQLSHSAILARSLHLPLVVGSPQSLIKINDGDVLLIDGGTGLVVQDPNANDLREHHQRIAESRRERRQLNRLRREPTRTLDGLDIKLWANAESRKDVTEAHALGAAGVGLYRTEFLFLESNTLPDEDTQFRAYRDAVLAMTGRTVTIRTLDLGADKADKTGLALRDEPNPALGLRGVRLSLARLDLLQVQLRAILRASGYGPVRVLLPMITSGEEVLHVRKLLAHTADMLRAEGHEIAAQTPLGAMIEVPSAALSLPTFIKYCDFLSVGTNDLVQYLLAADRTNEALETLYSPLHPAVLKILRDVVRTAQRHDTPITVCGEIAADPVYVPLLLALGLSELSLHPATLLEVRRAIRASHIGQLRAATPTLFRARNRQQIERWLAAHAITAQ